jgi:hypothetical protein
VPRAADIVASRDKVQEDSYTVDRDVAASSPAIWPSTGAASRLLPLEYPACPDPLTPTAVPPSA